MIAVPRYMRAAVAQSEMAAVIMRPMTPTISQRRLTATAHRSLIVVSLTGSGREEITGYVLTLLFCCFAVISVAFVIALPQLSDDAESRLANFASRGPSRT